MAQQPPRKRSKKLNKVVIQNCPFSNKLQILPEIHIQNTPIIRSVKLKYAQSFIRYTKNRRRINVLRMRPLSRKRYNVLRMQPLSRKRNASAQMRPLQSIQNATPVKETPHKRSNTTPVQQNDTEVLRRQFLLTNSRLSAQNASTVA